MGFFSLPVSPWLFCLLYEILRKAWLQPRKIVTKYIDFELMRASIHIWSILSQVAVMHVLPTWTRTSLTLGYRKNIVSNLGLFQQLPFPILTFPQAFKIRWKGMDILTTESLKYLQLLGTAASPKVPYTRRQIRLNPSSTKKKFGCKQWNLLNYDRRWCPSFFLWGTFQNEPLTYVTTYITSSLRWKLSSCILRILPYGCSSASLNISKVTKDIIDNKHV